MDDASIWVQDCTLNHFSSVAEKQSSHWLFSKKANFFPNFPGVNEQRHELCCVQTQATTFNFTHNSIFVEEIAEEKFWKCSAVYHQISFKITNIQKKHTCNFDAESYYLRYIQISKVLKQSFLSVWIDRKVTNWNKCFHHKKIKIKWKSHTFSGGPDGSCEPPQKV